ncbi:hypothetical protein ASE01_13750 [Nocardioides sp. Root190]|uniref:peptidylprolyl isomerase n=1 Tax=Nocardioides sp. Root190 TaxID=1736488 RepID=UPI0006FEF940|nr:peptidyl-prolyl cis-trans isomerase [Nocardioides sp. Root190]KRB76090.1 hypothetical protein ASE01_13750 [Nocardioides sp. Root190]
MTSSTDTAPAEDAVTPEVTLTKISGPSEGWRQRLRNTDRRRLAAVLVVLAVLAGGVTWWLLQRGDLPEDAAFRLGDVVVSADDVDRRVDGLQALYGVQPPQEGAEKSDFLRDAAKSMAVQLMLEDEARARDIVIAAKEVDETLQALITQRYPDGGRTAFVAALGELGATEEQVRDEIRDQLLVSRLFDDVAGGVDVTEAELEETFEERREELATPVRRTLSNIVVADEQAAQAVLQRLRRGQKFAAVARSTSLDSATRDGGGSLGDVSAADLEGDYAAAAFGAEVGGLFGPVKTESGWNVGKVERALPARAAVYAELRDALRETVLAEKSLEKWRGWLSEVIKGHDVTYADGFRPKDPDAVPDIDQANVTGSR